MWKTVLAVALVLVLMFCAGAAGVSGWLYYGGGGATEAWVDSGPSAEDPSGGLDAAEAEAAEKALEIDSEASRARAAQAYAQGRYAEAVSLYDAVLEGRPRDAEALAGRGRCYAKSGQDARAAQDFEAAIAVDRDRVDAWEGLAFVRSQSGDDRGAVEALDEAVRAAPRDGRLLRDRANARFRAGERALALSDASMSCTLGFQEGCTLAERMRSAR
jgi:tetratricopeptide (TPR) repeat protein